MHIVGVIIHGNPDKRYFFLAYPHLAGDSNLNLHCIRRALLLYCQDMGYQSLLPILRIQVDNAADNKSRYVIGTLASMILKGIVNQIELSMMLPGHTHEDIDQAFRVIQAALLKALFVATLEQYKHIIAHAWTGQVQHVEEVLCVHDCSHWMQGCVWESKPVAKDSDANYLVNINTARYFRIARRDSDGAVCLWYKPSTLYSTERPYLRDPQGSFIVDEASEYVTDPDGIEVFRTLQGPEGSPTLAAFPTMTAHKQKKIRENVMRRMNDEPLQCMCPYARRLPPSPPPSLTPKSRRFDMPLFRRRRRRR